MSQIGRYFSYCTAFHDKNIILHISDLFLGICEIPCHLCSVPNLLHYKYSEIVTGKLCNDILLQEEFEDTKRVIRIRKTKDRVTRAPLKRG
jgi:hypothetical protein